MINLPVAKNRKLPWNKIGEDVKGTTTTEEAIKAAGLNWKVVLQPLKIKSKEHPWPLYQMAICREDLLKKEIGVGPSPVLGLATPKYKPVQNLVAFSWLNPLLKKQYAQIVRAGSLKGGRKVWLIAKANRIITVAKEEVEVFILFYTSHDKSAAVRIRILPVRYTCTNVLTSVARGRVGGGGRDEFQLSVRHIGATDEKINAAMQLLRRLDKTLEETKTVYNAMLAHKATVKDMKLYVKHLFPDRDDSDNERRETLRDDLVELYQESPTLKVIRGTVWGMYNAITEYVSHGRERFEQRSSETRARTLWFGGGQKILQRAFTEAVHIVE